MVELDVTYLCFSFVYAKSLHKMFNLNFIFMKNLENFGVQELDAKEIRETEGGWLDRAVWGAVALVLAALNTDWDAAGADYSSGFKDAH